MLKYTCVQLYGQLLFGVMTFLIVNLGYFIIKLFAPGPPILVVLIILWLLYNHKVKKKYMRPMQLVSVHAAADLDRADTVRL